MVKLLKEQDDVHTTLAKMIVDTARTYVPTPERLKHMLEEMEAMRTFMKEGSDSKSFDCTISGLPVTLTHIEGSVRIDLGEGTTIVDPDDYDAYIDRLIERYSGADRVTVRKASTGILSDIVRNGLRPDGKINLRGSVMTQEDAIRIAEIIDDLTEEDENKEDDNEHTA